MARLRRWLPLSQAAALLGVDEATLRHWADLGKVRSFRTPGGHRRFLEEDIRTLMAPASPDRGQLAAALRRHTVHLVSGLPARRLRSAEWFTALDNSFRARAQAHGRQVIDLLVQSISGKSDRETVLAKFRALGGEYGVDLQRAGLSFTQAAEAFVFFRDLVLARALRALPSGETQLQAVREVSRLLDEMLVAIARTYESRRKDTAR